MRLLQVSHFCVSREGQQLLIAAALGDLLVTRALNSHAGNVAHFPEVTCCILAYVQDQRGQPGKRWRVTVCTAGAAAAGRGTGNHSQ
jgi:hypothetical protein